MGVIAWYSYFTLDHILNSISEGSFHVLKKWDLASQWEFQDDIKFMWDCTSIGLVCTSLKLISKRYIGVLLVRWSSKHWKYFEDERVIIPILQLSYIVYQWKTLLPHPPGQVVTRNPSINWHLWSHPTSQNAYICQQIIFLISQCVHDFTVLQSL